MKTYARVKVIVPSFLALALNEGGQLHTPAALPPAHIGQEAGWGPKPVWKLRSREKSLVHVKN
jgi:hypothetical protein